MRPLMAFILLCLGAALAHAAAGKAGLHSDSAVSETSKQGSLPSGSAYQRKGGQVPPATEKQNFNGSWLGPGALFVWINPGTFQMGSTRKTDPDSWNWETIQQLTFTQGFWFLDHEVTQQEFEWITQKPSRSKFKGQDLPVENVTLGEAEAFCQKLTSWDRSRGKISATQKYRLPTSWEWEYACRAGTTGVRYTVNGVDVSLSSIAWYQSNSGGTTHPVKLKSPNPWGFYDMLGNVGEWCLDWIPSGTYFISRGSEVGFYVPRNTYRRVRGGNWESLSDGVRSAAVDYGDPGESYSSIGFRPLLTPP
jgi:formylglycine-generating enzyme required for sulfatase activity